MTYWTGYLIGLGVLALLVHPLISAAAPEEVAAASQPTAAQVRPLSEEELAALLEAVGARFGQVRTLRVRFRQEKRLSILVEPLVSRGELLFAEPDCFRLEYTEPFASITLAAGETIHCLEKMPDGWRSIDVPTSVLRRVTRQIPTWIRGRFIGEDDIYAITAVQGRDYLLTLTPRSKEFRQYIQRIELRIPLDLSRIAEVIIHESATDATHMIFDREIRNRPIPKTLFTLRPNGTAVPLPPFPQPQPPPVDAVPATQPSAPDDPSSEGTSSEPAT